MIVKGKITRIETFGGPQLCPLLDLTRVVRRVRSTEAQQPERPLPRLGGARTHLGPYSHSLSQQNIVI